MTSEREDCDPQALLRHRAFVAAIAARLVADPNDAADLEQEAWTAALDRPPRVASPSWFRRVLDHLSRNRARGERRRLLRELAAARTEATPSTVELLSRLELERRVVDAVTGMEEPFRTVLLLRFYEDLAPREIAERLSIPVETVHSRVKRGIERLRAALAARHGRDWRAALLPLVPALRVKSGVAAASVATLVTGGVITMSTTKIAATVTGLVLLGGAIWYAVDARVTLPRSDRERALASESDAMRSPASVVATSPTREEAPTDSPSASPATDQLATSSASTTGSLRVHVLWDDQTSAQGVLVGLERVDSRGDEDSGSEPPRGTSDPDGIVRFLEVAPGRVAARLLRGDMGEHEWAEATIQAGVEAEATLKLGPGMNVDGIVVDGHDAPVADAEIVLSDWGGGEGWTLARSAADGTFRLRAVGTHTHIGARAPGFAPSPMRQFTASEGADVRQRIVLPDGGAELTGVVLGPLDVAVAGALVMAGDYEQKMRTLPDGGTAMAARPLLAHTDAQGRFTLRGLPSGRLPLGARARGLAPWQQEIELVADRKNELTIKLQPGVSLVGTVRDDRGVPVAGADVEIGEWQQLGHRRVASDAHGAFHCDGLAAGELRLRAVAENRGKAETKLRATAGETLHCDVTLSRGLEFRGRVLDESDRPVEGAIVEGRIERARRGSEWYAFSNTGKDGRFVLQNCTPDLVFHLSVRRGKSIFPEVQLERLVAGGEERVIRLPKEAWTRIRGRVLDPEGDVLSNVHVSPWMVGGNGSPAETADPSGAFDLGPYPPGEFHLSLQAEGYPAIRLGPRQLGMDEIWDVGTLHFSRGGTLAVSLVSDRAAAPQELTCWIYDGAGESSEFMMISSGQGRSGPLVPGSYRLQVADKAFACEELEFEIRASEETRLEVPLRSGVAVSVPLELPEGETPRGGIRCVVADSSGKVTLRTSVWDLETPVLKATLAPGEYTVTATTSSCRGDAVLTVPAAESTPTRIVLTRR